MWYINNAIAVKGVANNKNPNGFGQLRGPRERWSRNGERSNLVLSECMSVYEYKQDKQELRRSTMTTTYFD